MSTLVKSGHFAKSRQCPLYLRKQKARCTGFLRANKLASNGLDKIWP
jgi:hypothetical protein